MDYYEVSVKVTRQSVKYDRYSFGFFPSKVNAAELIESYVGRERFQEFSAHFRREIFEPRDDETIMIGWDGQEYEMYVQSYGTGRSYDLGRKMMTNYQIVEHRYHAGVYKALSVLPPVVYQAIPRDARFIFARESPHHKCVFLFKYNGIELSEALKSAARMINPDVVFDIKEKVYVLAVAITKDDEPEMVIYFR